MAGGVGQCCVNTLGFESHPVYASGLRIGQEFGWMVAWWQNGSRWSKFASVTVQNRRVPFAKPTEIHYMHDRSLPALRYHFAADSDVFVFSGVMRTYARPSAVCISMRVPCTAAFVMLLDH